MKNNMTDDYLIVFYLYGAVEWVKTYHSIDTFDRNWKYYASFFPDSTLKGKQSLVGYQVFEDSKQILVVREKHGKV